MGLNDKCPIHGNAHPDVLCPADEITINDCDYHRLIGEVDWCDLSDNPCYVGIIDGNECDEFNDLKKEHSE